MGQIARAFANVQTTVFAGKMTGLATALAPFLDRIAGKSARAKTAFVAKLMVRAIAARVFTESHARNDAAV